MILVCGLVGETPRCVVKGFNYLPISAQAYLKTKLYKFELFIPEYPHHYNNSCHVFQKATNI